MAEEADIVYSRGAFADVQDGLAVFPSLPIAGVFSCGWYGTSVDDERGSFCVVNEDGPLADKVGDYIRLSYKTRSVTVYCLEALSLPYDVAITRRAFWGLAPLWTSFLDVRVADIQDQ